MRVRKVLTVLLAAGCTVASLLTPASAATTGPAIDNSSLMNGGMPCSTSTPPSLGYFARSLQVLGTDPAPPYGSHFVYSFAIWPQSDPSTVTTFSTTNYNIGQLARGQVPYGLLSSGTSYSWHVQLTDGNGTSPWSQTCNFSYGYTPPQQPTITSNFPSGCCSPGPVGVLPQFTFSGNGDPDTVGFQWAWGNSLYSLSCADSGPQGQTICPDPLSFPGVVRADAPGGTASVAQNPPSGGPASVTVAALDRAGNESQPVTYQLFIPYSGPTVTVTSSQPTCGSNTATVSFAPYPGVTGVVSYTYTLNTFNGSQPVTVPADQNGQATATVDVSSQPHAIVVTSLSSNGFVSSMGYASLEVNTVPTVTADVYQNSGQPVGGPGVAGSFTFSPPFDGHTVTGYRYSFSHGPTRTITADQNSETATVRYLPAGPGTETLTVQSLHDDPPGGSCQLSYTFVVASKH